MTLKAPRLAHFCRYQLLFIHMVKHRFENSFRAGKKMLMSFYLSVTKDSWEMTTFLQTMYIFVRGLFSVLDYDFIHTIFHPFFFFHSNMACYIIWATTEKK